MRLAVAFLVVLTATAALARAPRTTAVAATKADARAEESLFSRNDLGAARREAQAVLARNPRDRRALFVEMEAAALAGGDAAALEPALRLSSGQDVLARIAAARIAELAGNKPAFLERVPALRQIINGGAANTPRLREALRKAAAEGAQGLSLRNEAAAAGLLTRWRIRAAAGKNGNVDFDRVPVPEKDPSAEEFEFPDGVVHLPEYLTANGVYFATAEFQAVPHVARLELQSAGTVMLLLDGAPILTRDARFEVAPERTAITLWLRPGRHQLTVKFLASAVPFRIALGPAGPAGPEAPARLGADAAAFADAAGRYWSGDYAGAIEATEDRTGAAFLFLRAEAMRRFSPSDPELAGTLQQALRAAPDVFAAQLRLAQRRIAMERYDVAAEQARALAAALPESPGAQEAAFSIARHLSSETEAEAALQRRLRLHPTCHAWRDAVNFYSEARRFADAEAAVERLHGCAPGSLAYASELSASGQHAEAAQAALAVAHEYPLDRDALAMAVEELVLAGDTRQATEIAGRLAALAPLSPRFQDWRAQLHASPAPAVLDVREAQMAGVTGGMEFYRPYRRDGLAIVERTRNRQFVGGLAVKLLDDRVAQLDPDGAPALYVHQLLRLLNRGGVERYGEVALPEGAEVLELRTLQPDGSTVEPEVTANKRTISMPALAPGSVVEQEYVLRFADRGGIAAHPELFRYTFGSLEAPVLFARFTAITPANVQAIAAPGLPDAVTAAAGGRTSRTWEAEDLPQPASETAMPAEGLLPQVRLVEPAGWGDIRDRYRDALIAATRVGPRVRTFAAALHGSDLERLQQAYARLLAQVQRAGGSISEGELTTAEQTLASGQGSRTAAMVAIGAVEGWKPELLLARRIERPRDSTPEVDTYERPLARLWMRDGSGGETPVLLDLETDGMTFGGVPGELARTDALLVPRMAPAAGAPVIVALGSSAPDESLADASLALDAGGNLATRLTITMGPSRAAQMRSILRGIARDSRQHFFDQLALRIFPGAGEVTGRVLHEDDVLQPLEIELACRARHFVDLSTGAADLDQIAPALGLRRMYATAESRRFPLFLDTPLFETATFHLALPPGVRLTGGRHNVELRSTFGSYRAKVGQPAPGEVEIVRAFHLDPQLIAPEQYGAFLQFARRIEAVERQRLTLQGPVFSSRAPRLSKQHEPGAVAAPGSTFRND